MTVELAPGARVLVEARVLTPPELMLRGGVEVGFGNEARAVVPVEFVRARLCGLCGRELRSDAGPDDPALDCGGDCLACMRAIEAE